MPLKLHVDWQELDWTGMQLFRRASHKQIYGAAEIQLVLLTQNVHLSGNLP